MSCYTTPIIDSIKGRYPSYIVDDKKGEIFIPVGSKYKTLDQTYMVARRLYNEVGKQYGKYGHMSSLYTQDNGTLLKIHPTKMFRDYMDLAEKVKEGEVKKDKAQELLDKDAQERVNQERAMGIDEFGDSNTNLLSSDRLNLQPNILQDIEGFKDFVQGKQFQNPNNVNYQLKAVGILSSDKAKQVFEKGKKNNWDLNKILTELQVPKEQKQLILNLGITNREQIALELASNYSYTIEINTAKESKGNLNEGIWRDGKRFEYDGNIYEVREINYTPRYFKNNQEISFDEIVDAEEKLLRQTEGIQNTQHYSNLTVPGGINYTEDAHVIPVMKGKVLPDIYPHHDQEFANGNLNMYGWNRSDDKIDNKTTDLDLKYIYIKEGYDEKMSFDSFKLYYYEKEEINPTTNTKTRRILEIQSKFQKWRLNFEHKNNKYQILENQPTDKPNVFEDHYLENGKRITSKEYNKIFEEFLDTPTSKEDAFIKLIAKQWETMMIKSIIADSAKKGYEKVLFPLGDTASKIEGHTTLEEFKKQKEDRIKELEKEQSKLDSNLEQGVYGLDTSDYDLRSIKILEEIDTLEKELERVETEGFDALKPIYNFYENTVANILKKQGYNPVEITDEYGNKWNEVKVERDSFNQIVLQPKIQMTQEDVQIRNDEQQEFDNFLDTLDLTQEEKTRASDKFRNDFGNTSMMPTMATGTTTPINDFVSYRQYKIELLDKLQQKLKRFKVSNKSNYGTTKYKDTVYQYNQTINKLKEDIAALDITDANNVFSDVIDEMDYLNSVLDNPNFETIANQEVIDRISFLARHIIGRDEDINTPELQWDGSAYQNYNTAVLNKMNDLLNKLSKKRIEIIQSVIDNDIILTEAKQYLTEEEFNKLFSQKMRDIGIFEKNFLGINSNDDAITMTLAHIVFQTAIQKNKQQSRESVEALKKFDAILHDKKFSMDNFFEKDSDGVDTGNLIHKFTTKYFRKISEYFKLNKEFDDAKPNQKGLVYAKKIALMKNNFEVIDFRKLKYFKAVYGNHPKYGSYFTFSDAEMQAYEDNLRNTLGKIYDEHIDRVSRKLEEFQDHHINQEASGDKWAPRYIISNSPWEFVNNYYSSNSNNSIAYPNPNGGASYVYNNSSYIELIPKKQVLDVNTNTMKDTGYYNSNFDKIENDDDAFNYWTTIRELYERDINPTYGNVRGLSIGKIERTFAEEILRSKGIAGFFKVLYSAIKEHAKRMWFDRANYSDKMGIKSNYHDTSNNEIYKITKALGFMNTQEINRRARELNLTTREENVIRNGLGRLDGDNAVRKYRDEIINRIARKEVFSGYSNDLTKITIALVDLAAMQRARQDTQFLAELIMKQHESVRTDDDANEYRVKSNEKLRKWINTNIYNDRALGKNKPGSIMAEEKRNNIFMYYTEAEKRLSEMLKNIQSNLDGTGDYSFKVGNNNYERKGGKYFKFDEDGNRTDITQDTFESAIESYINEETKNMGIGITPNSVIDGFIKTLVYKTFAGNLVSGFFNRSEGMFTNMIMDRSGKFWTPGNRNLAKSFLALANLNKISRNRLNAIHRRHFSQLQTYQLLLDELSLFQDKKNELERRDKQSRYNKFKETFNVFQFAIDNPEFKNQSEVILSMMMDITITDRNGKVHKFFDGSSFPAYRPSTLELKDEFKFNADGSINEYNIGWENFTLNDSNKKANQFFVSKLRIEDAIKQTQGNYSNTDSIAFTTKNNWGRLAMLFMRWFPEHFNQRFGKREVNLVQGKTNQVGRYRGILKSIPSTSIFAATAFTIASGPMAGLIAGGLPLIGWGVRAIYGKAFLNESIKSQLFDIRTTLGFLQEMAIQSLAFYPKTLYFGKVANRLDGIKNPLIASNKKLTEAEIGAMRAMAKEAAIMINQLIITILLKAALWDDDDDKDSAKRKLYNFIDNQGNRMMNSLSSWSNISKLWTDNSQFALLRDLKNMYDTIDDLADKGFTKDTWGTIVKEQPFIPIPNIVTNAYFKDAYPGFDKKEYQSSQWFDNMSKSGEWRVSKEYKDERAKFKSYYEEKVRREIEAANPNLEGNLLDKAVKSAVRRRMNDSDVSRNSKQDETYKDALKRINYDSLMKTAEEENTDYNWLDEDWLNKNSPQK